jgi:hypothetical protein
VGRRRREKLKGVKKRGGKSRRRELEGGNKGRG